MSTIGAVQTRSSHAPSMRAKSAETEETTKGKSASSPAHLARLEAAKDNRENPPANLFGKITSALARGMPLTNILVLQSEQPLVDEPATPGTDAGTSLDGSPDPTA
jgi:hypothetical protein